MNIVIYARFSSHSQNEQSIEGQLKVCYDFAERNGYKIVGEYIDRALSGTSDNRPEFQRMITDSAKRQFQAVLVYQLDRFARNRYDSATYKAKRSSRKTVLRFYLLVRTLRTMPVACLWRQFLKEWQNTLVSNCLRR